MNKNELLQKGLIPKYITAEQAAELEIGGTVEDINYMVKLKNVKSKQLDTGERVIDTLDILRIIKRSDRWFSQEQRQRRVRYLMRLMKNKSEKKVRPL